MELGELDLGEAVEAGELFAGGGGLVAGPGNEDFVKSVEAQGEALDFLGFGDGGRRLVDHELNIRGGVGEAGIEDR